MRRPLRIATTEQLERSVRAAGFECHRLPLANLDFHRSLAERQAEGPAVRSFLESRDIDLVLDFNTSALTFVPDPQCPRGCVVTSAALGIPHVSCYLDPITSTMGQVDWADHWRILESAQWIKWIWETAHAEELVRFGVPNVVTLPMAAANDDFDTSSLPEPDPGPAVAFMGHPATTWFRSDVAVRPDRLQAGLTAAAVHGDFPDLAFHKIFFDLYGFMEPPERYANTGVRARMTREYFDQKFAYHAFLAVRQRDRFVKFLKGKLGDSFELIGDHWESVYGLKHTPRIWNMQQLHDRMRRVPICLNLMKGCLESGLNIRHFEITAYGGFMLTYATPELAQYFEVGSECDVFRNEAELLDKIAFYLDHSARRREMAAAGQRRTLSDHLYSHRITRLTEMLESAGILAQAPTVATSAPCAG